MKLSIVRTYSLVEPTDLFNCTNLSIFHDFTQIFNFCDYNPRALLNVFLASNNNLCSAVALPSLATSDHVGVSVSIAFSSKMDINTNSIDFDYYHADWNEYMTRFMGGYIQSGCFYWRFWILKIQYRMDVYIPEIEITVGQRV